MTRIVVAAAIITSVQPVLAQPEPAPNPWTPLPVPSPSPAPVPPDPAPATIPKTPPPIEPAESLPQLAQRAPDEGGGVPHVAPPWSTSAELLLAIPQGGLATFARTSRGLRAAGARAISHALEIFAVADLVLLFNQPGVDHSVSADYYGVRAGVRVGELDPTGWTVALGTALGWQGITGSYGGNGLALAFSGIVGHPVAYGYAATFSVDFTSSSIGPQMAQSELSMWILGAGVSRAF